MCFDDFIDKQSVSYYLLRNSLLNGKLSHAYLIDTNSNDYAYDFILSFIKMILCPYHYSNFSGSECRNCSQCLRIDNGNYPEIKVIESDSMVIKKEQLLELQNDFSKSSIEGSYRVYIIKDCDKMNKQASNSLLKFLEEPQDGIIAFLLTDHFSKVLSTIVSRCQVLHFNHVISLKNNSSFENFAIMCCNSNSFFDEFIHDDHKIDIFNCVIDFILYFEENGLDVLLYMKKLWYNKIQTREENLLGFQAMIYFYYDVFNYVIGKDNYVFCDHVDVIKRIAGNNSLDSIIAKLDIFQYGYDMVVSNLNINLLMDDIVIRLGDVR